MRSRGLDLKMDRKSKQPAPRSICHHRTLFSRAAQTLRKNFEKRFYLLCSSGRWLSQVSGLPSTLTIAGAAGVAFEEVPLGFPFGMVKEELNIQNNPKFK